MPKNKDNKKKRSNFQRGAETQSSSPVTETTQNVTGASSSNQTKRKNSESDGFLGRIGRRMSRAADEVNNFFSGSPTTTPKKENFGDNDVATSPTETDNEIGKNLGGNAKKSEQITLFDNTNETVRWSSGEEGSDNSEIQMETESSVFEAAVDTSNDQMTSNKARSSERKEVVSDDSLNKMGSNKSKNLEDNGKPTDLSSSAVFYWGEEETKDLSDSFLGNIPIISSQEEVLNFEKLKSELNSLKEQAIRADDCRKLLISRLAKNDQNWGDYWKVWHGLTEISVEEWINQFIKDERLQEEAWKFFNTIKKETREEMIKNQEEEDSKETVESSSELTEPAGNTNQNQILAKEEEKVSFTPVPEDEEKISTYSLGETSISNGNAPLLGWGNSSASSGIYVGKDSSVSDKNREILTVRALNSRYQNKKPGNRGKIVIVLVIGTAVVGVIGVGVERLLRNRRKAEVAKKMN